MTRSLWMALVLLVACEPARDAERPPTITLEPGPSEVQTADELRQPARALWGGADGFRRNGEATIPVGVRDPVLGSDEARVTLVVFGDFECPACAAISREIALVKTTTKDVRLVWKHYPLDNHPHALSAAETATAVHAMRGDDAFWRFHDLLFANQTGLSDSELRRHAEAVGVVNVDALRSNSAVRDKVVRDRSLGETLHLDAVPAIYINCRLFSFEADLGEDLPTRLRRDIESELRQATSQRYAARCAANIGDR